MAKHFHICNFHLQSSVTGGWLSSGTSDACQKAHQHTTPCKCLLNCSPAPHQSLIGGESQEDQEAQLQGGVVFSGTYISLHKRYGQRLMIAKDGERNGPLSTTRSDDDDDDDDDDGELLSVGETFARKQHISYVCISKYLRITKSR